MNYIFANRMEGVTGNAIREIFKLLQKPEVISFAGGMPAAESFPVTDIIRITDEVLSQSGSKILQYGDTEGYAPLRDTLVPWLTGKDIEAAAEDILITSGSQQGIDLTCKAFLNPGDKVLVESPTYLAALQILKTYEADAIPVCTDEEGIDLTDLEEKIKKHSPKLLYLIPTFQNPTGKTLPLERRKAVVDLAVQNDIVVIEDDPYRDLRYKGQALPAMKSFDKLGNVIYLASFSKLISPGLRVGCAVAPLEILRKMIIGKQATDVHTSNLSQAIVNQYLKEGRLEPHLIKICADYTIRLNKMNQMLEQYFPSELTFTHPEGGLFIWVVLPEHIEAQQLLKKSIAKNVAFIPGTSFFVDGSGKNTMRLNFSNSSEERIETGMKILAQVMKEEMV